MDRTSYAVIAVVGIALVAGGGALWWSRREAPPPAAAPVAAAPRTALPPTAPAASEPAIRYPVETPPAAGAPADVRGTLAEVFGAPAVASMFQLDDFPHRFVATVDNLGRAHAPAGLWPVRPAAGRFTVTPGDGADTIAAGNAVRYAALVQLAESVDLPRAVAAYARLYPLFQRSYEELGYPGRYFNDRLVEVIELLLETPDPDAAPKVRLPPIQGPVRPERPWLLYEFDDPQLQSLAAGQKMLLRMGPANERRLKARLSELRRLLVAAAAKGR